MNRRQLPINFMVQSYKCILASLLSLNLCFCDDQSSSSSQNFSQRPLLDLSILSACNDQRDNDGDGLIDFPEDPGCSSQTDIDEGDVIETGPCSDSLDNDNDGLIDGNDPGCIESLGEHEFNEAVLPQCSNGADDDGDGYIDYPIDDSCLSPDGDDEGQTIELSACNNQRDDDADGLVDYPFDPGCASADDLDERDDFDASMIAQCNDGIDNDQDGYADLADPQCATPNDPRERLLDDEGTAVCSNGIDDDEDGLTDAQEDPGCLGPGGASELDDNIPECADKEDNDFDGYTDYPEDPGCQSLGDLSEVDPSTLPACLDGIDNDTDGSIDYPQDSGCDSSADISEQGFCFNSGQVIELLNGGIYQGSSRQGRFYRKASCGGQGAPELTALYQVREPIRRLRFVTKAIAGEEPQGWETTLYVRKRCDEPLQEIACQREEVDGVAYNELIIENPPVGPLYLLIDGASGQGGSFELLVEEVSIEACQNGVDDDDDGAIDFPFDPGCESPNDQDESSPTSLPQCANEIDDDLDMLIDYPNDIGCRAAFDDDETDECGQGIPVYHFSVDTDQFFGYSTLDGQSSESMGQCGGFGIEQVLRYDNPSHPPLHFELYRTDGIAESAYLYARIWECGQTSNELGCAEAMVGEPIEIVEEDDESMLSPETLLYGRPLTLVLDSVPQGTVYLFVDHDLDGLPFLLKTKRRPLSPLCNDGADNDGDGLVDAQDPGCENSADEDERDPRDPSDCADGRDNDLDGWTDYPLDPGCAFFGGNREEDPVDLPQCINGIDDNGDGYTDFPNDQGCHARGDDSEANVPFPPRCSNVQDDDEDGLIDFPYDPGCVARGDDDERDLERVPHCTDGLDNDQNGLIDFPFDPGCYAAGDHREQATENPSACSDGLDNDQDGFIDLPYDPGCESSGDESEVDPLIPPQCANGIDDDLNERIDWPDDPGCISRADTREDAGGTTLPRCADGVDNDDDGQIDLMDLDCRSRSDSSEAASPEDELISPTDRQCADGIDNDGDQTIDWPNDVGCAAAGDLCETGGFMRCATDSNNNEPVFTCIDVLTDSEHCGSCENRCNEGQPCTDGLCQGVSRTIRPRIMNCGSLFRPISNFLVGPLDGVPFIPSASCTPDQSVQALLVTRSGLNGLTLNLEDIRTYLAEGGIVISEQGVGPRLYGSIFGIPTFDTPQLGQCRGNIQPIVNHRPQDPLWNIVPHSAPQPENSGCGDDLHNLPGIIKLGGWDTESTSLAYRDYGRGRLWLLASDWRGFNADATEESLNLMAAMISGLSINKYAPTLPECMDRYDNDLDGFIDLEDSDCQASRDESEWSFDHDSVECQDGFDNDADGFIDFPFDPECHSAGDTSEEIGPFPEGYNSADNPSLVSECNDGIDNNGDGLVDWPWDLACLGRGDLKEGRPEAMSDCNNGQDDDDDGLVDFPIDPDCLASTGSSETPTSRTLLYPHGISIDTGLGIHRFRNNVNACANRADDDRDGLVDYPADPECESPRDNNESELNSIQEWGSNRFTSTLSQCLDGIDNDNDGLIDLNDVACSSPYDLAHESDDQSFSIDELPKCADQIDNDEDALIDWPSDLNCGAHGADQERECSLQELPALRTGESVNLTPWTEVEEEILLAEQLSPQYCGPSYEGQAPQLFRVTQNEDGPFKLRFDQVELGSSDEHAFITVALQNYCGVQAQVLNCQALDLSPDNSLERQITMDHLAAGEYILSINQAPQTIWESKARPINLPEDPRNYEANDDITSICWQDGGQDSFDCMGRVRITFNEQVTSLNVALGYHRLRLDDQTLIAYSSEKVNSNLWRLRFWRVAPVHSEYRIDIEFYGNLGLDAATTQSFGQSELAGYFLPYWRYTDHSIEAVKPPVQTMLIPSNPSDIERIGSMLIIDQVSLTASDVQLPLTYYLSSSYLPQEDILRAIETDIVIDDDRGYKVFTPNELTVTLNPN